MDRETLNTKLTAWLLYTSILVWHKERIDFDDEEMSIKLFFPGATPFCLNRREIKRLGRRRLINHWKVCYKSTSLLLLVTGFVAGHPEWRVLHTAPMDTWISSSSECQLFSKLYEWTHHRGGMDLLTWGRVEIAFFTHENRSPMLPLHSKISTPPAKQLERPHQGLNHLYTLWGSAQPEELLCALWSEELCVVSVRSAWRKLAGQSCSNPPLEWVK